MSRKKAFGAHGNVAAALNTGADVPTSVKKLRGTYHRKNELAKLRRNGINSEDELMPSLDVPEELMLPPDTLMSASAVQEWNMFIVPLMKAKVIALSDLRIAELYCDAWGAYQDFKASMKEMKLTGVALASAFPLNLVKQMTQFMMQMGLTPVARHRVVRLMSQKGSVEKDEWAEILNHG